MSGSTSVENKNNACVVCTEVKTKEKENKLSIEIGNYGQKGQDGDYILPVIDGKIMHPDDSAKPKIDQYNKNVKEITKYEDKKQGKEDSDREI